jgi:hypothetical protein
VGVRCAFACRYSAHEIQTERHQRGPAPSPTLRATSPARGEGKVRREQAQRLFIFHNQADIGYMERRIREETINEYGIEALES